MQVPLYQIDAFASRLFTGNPAAVCLLDHWLPDQTLQAIAAENNLSETAFLVGDRDPYQLRWFTPTTEIDLCGHATLAAAFVVLEMVSPEQQKVCFVSPKSGELTVWRHRDLLRMDFPARVPVRCACPVDLAAGLGIEPRDTLQAEDFLVVVEDEEQVRSLQPDIPTLCRLEKRGVIVTAPGRQVDFVSRFFAPKVGVNEDPVTGSAHCTLIPYWHERLGKRRLHARQISQRGGELFCEARGERVAIAGRAILYMEGTLHI